MARHTDKAYIDEAFFSRLMGSFTPFESRATIAVGVSGGIDSMVLMLLLDSWCRAHDFHAVGLIVDHGLRAESTQEARCVHSVLRDKGIDVHILSCPHTEVVANKQAWARHHRYALLNQWCLRNHVLHLASAHHLDDQFETFFLRLARGSGVYGLAAMSAERFLPSVRLLRPLLSVERARIVATAQRLSLSTDTLVDDPSNHDERFARTRLRAQADVLAQQGFTRWRTSRTIAALARARTTLEDNVRLWTQRFVCVYPQGYALLLRDGLTHNDDEIALQGVGRVLRMVSGTTFMPRLTTLQRLCQSLYDSNKALTLHGCLVRYTQQGWLIMREPAYATECTTTKNKKTLLWDRRFKVFSAQEGFICRALQEEGRLLLRKNKQATARYVIPAASVAIYRSLPSLWQRDSLKVAFDTQGKGFDAHTGAPCQASMTFCPTCPIT